MVNFRRALRHLPLSHRHVRRLFSKKSLQRIEAAINEGKTAHVGEICFVVEGALTGMHLMAGQTARERAIVLFSELRVWDTEHNNGVLIYLLLADRAVEIVADRGISAKIPQIAWEQICRDMEAAFRDADYVEGVVAGIRAVARHLTQTFPAQIMGENELSAEPVVL